MRTLAAKRIANNVSKGMEPKDAIEEAMNYSTRVLGSDGGAIALTSSGVIGATFNSHRMGWAFTEGNHLVSGCDRGQTIEEKLL